MKEDSSILFIELENTLTKLCIKLLSSISATILLTTAAIQTASAFSLTIRNDVPGNASSSILYGLMYEDINRCGDGGLYGEMLRNWNFQANDTGGEPSLEFWSAIGVGGGNISLDYENGLNNVNKNSLRLDVTSVADGRVGFANEGWWGLRVQPGETYKASFFAKSDKYTGTLNVTLETTDGSTVLASAQVSGLSKEFQKFEVTLKPTQVDSASIDNRFVVSTDAKEAEGSSIFFQVFTLFGETYKNRENGLRKDIAETLANLNPSFFRFPGGNNLEGQTIENRWKWNETVGPLEERIGRMGDWTYWNTNGQGLLDYMYLCEDLNIEPILGVYAGYSLGGTSVPEDQLGPYIQEVLNELEYLMGDEFTTYGALRAKHGHPEPFKINYIEIGNEDWFSTTYEYRYKAYYDAIHGAYPNVTIIETALQTERPWNLLDDHYYDDAKTMIGNFGHYDNYPRNSTGIFVGEFATNVCGCCGNSSANLEAALADGVFITGLERNSDLVKMIAYAPTMKRYGHEQWDPDMIHFDTESVWLTPTYHVFQLWSNNRADTILQVDAADGGFDPLYWVVGSNEKANELYVKMVNTGSVEETVNFKINGLKLKNEGTAKVVTGNSLSDENTKNSTTVNITESTFRLNSSTSFTYTFAPYSATVLVLSH